MLPANHKAVEIIHIMTLSKMVALCLKMVAETKWWEEVEYTDP